MLDLADWLLLLSSIPAAIFWLSFGLGSPWYRSALGWVIFLYAMAVALILGLVVYAIVAGEAAPPLVRITVAAFLLAALWGKVIILYVERAAGRRLRNTTPRKD